MYICLSETTNYMNMTTRTLKRAKYKLAATRWRASDRSCFACRRCQTCICLMPYKTYHQIWQGVAVTVKWFCLFRETHSATSYVCVYIYMRTGAHHPSFGFTELNQSKNVLRKDANAPTYSPKKDIFHIKARLCAYSTSIAIMRIGNFHSMA